MSWGANFFIGMASINAPDFQDLTFMHELGHSLGLRHRGFENLNRKPNYPSVMNYNWNPIRFCPNSSWPRLEFSTGSVTTNLTETRLEESTPLAGLPHTTIFAPESQPGFACIYPNSPVDWNTDGDTQDVCLFCDVNVNGAGDDQFRDHDDWSNLSFFDRGVAGFAPESFEPEIVEEGLQDAYNEQAFVPVEAQVKPGANGAPPINVKSRGVVPVALISNRHFHAVDADFGSASFGATGSEAPAQHCSLEDVNDDGVLDLQCHFKVEDTGLNRQSEYGVMRVENIDGFLFSGVAYIRVVP